LCETGRAIAELAEQIKALKADYTINGTPDILPIQSRCQ
jgi:hypothetical protein